MERSEPAGCPGDDVVAAHLAGELDVEAAGVVAGHLDRCRGCRAVVVALVKAAAPSPAAGEAPALMTVAGTAVARRRGPGVSIGGTVDRYRVIRLVGSGGMGMVYAAHDSQLDRAVALKVMRPELGAVATLADRLVRESRLMARVSHPSVITVYDVGRHGDQVFVAMELIEGVTLGGWLRAQRRPWREVVEVFRRAGEGLAAAHRAGLVHRDFKPENVLLAFDGDRPSRVVVTDLGVARALAGDDGEGYGVPTTPATPVHATLTATGVAVGTPAYMAPEQLDAGRVDGRADLFAFAVALWEALWGERPFPGRSVAEIRAAIDRGPPAALRRPGARGAVGQPPRWIERVLRGALAVDPDRRPPSIDELLRRLDPRRHDRQRRIWLATATLAVTLAVGVGVVAASRSDDRAPGVVRSPCDDDGLAAVWTEPARQRLRAAVLDTGNPVAARIADRAIVAASAWVTRWGRVRDAVCTAERSDAFATEAACLRIRRDELAALLAVVPELSSADRVQLDLTMTAMPNVEVCGTPASAGVAGEFEAPAAQQAEVTALRQRFFEIDARRLAGDYRGAVAALEALAPAVAALDLGAITADHLFNLAIAVGELDSARASDLLRRAAAAAEKARHDDLAARAWLELGFGYGERGEVDRAEDSQIHADAAIARAGDSPVLRVQWLHNQGRLRFHQGRFAESVALFHDAVALAEQVAPDAMVQLEQMLAASLSEQGAFEEALALDRKGVAEREAQFGADHVLVAQARNQVAADLQYLGDIDGALAELTAALAIAERAYGPDNEWTGMYLQNMAVALSSAGRYDEALAIHERALPVMIANHGQRDPRVGLALENEAGALIGLQRWTEAAARLGEALAVYRSALGDGSFETAKCRINLAEAWRALGRLDDAIDEQTQGLAVVRAIHGDDHPFVAYARGELGKTLLVAGRAGEAVAELEAAVRIYAGSEMDPAAAADSQFALARALAAEPTQRGRAVALATGALAAFEDAGGEWIDDAAAARAWLAARPRRGR